MYRERAQNPLKPTQFDEEGSETATIDWEAVWCGADVKKA
jgi:hypothetical protein